MVSMKKKRNKTGPETIKSGIKIERRLVFQIPDLQSMGRIVVTNAAYDRQYLQRFLFRKVSSKQVDHLV